MIEGAACIYWGKIDELFMKEEEDVEKILYVELMEGIKWNRLLEGWKRSILTNTKSEWLLMHSDIGKESIDVRFDLPDWWSIDSQLTSLMRLLYKLLK